MSSENDRGPGPVILSGSHESFERMLERVFESLHATEDRRAGIQEAIERIAAYFTAARVEIVVPGVALAAGETSAEVEPDLEVTICVGSKDECGRAALFGSRRAAARRARDARQFRVAAQIVGDAICRVEAAVDLSEQQFWLLMAMESAAVGVWDWDLEADRVRYLSPSVTQEGGVHVQETTASAAEDWCHPDDLLDGWKQDLERAIAGESDTFTQVVRQRRRSDPNGPWHRIYSRGRVIERDPSGRARRIMGTFEDVTQAYEKELVEKARDVAMSRATRMASMGVLASSLAHDLNQPLTVLTGYLEGTVRMVAEGTATETDVAKALERSVAFAYRASDVVRRFRRLLRREAPMADSVDLAALVRQVRDSMGRDAATAGVEIEIQEDFRGAVVRGDGLQIEQAVIQLVRNAVEALAGADHLRKRVRLDVRSVDHRAELRVADNGPGIPDEVAEDLFEPLTTTREAGRGLGLAICHSVAELHGGQLQVERTGPDGTVFLLSLPSDDGGDQ
jgi:signal transduction histidine kinase